MILRQLFAQTRSVKVYFAVETCVIRQLFSPLSFFPLLERKQTTLIILADGKSLQFTRQIHSYAERRPHIIDGKTLFVGYRR